MTTQAAAPQGQGGHGPGGGTPYLFVDSLTTTQLSVLPNVVVGDKNVVVEGFEAYLVEQWCSERRSNRVVCSYTGNTSNKVTANVLLLPKRENWAPQLAEFMELMSQNHLLTKDTSLGRMFIANLSSFPSNKTLIPMNDLFYLSLHSFNLNENLKRLGCSGRLAVSLNSPSDATKSNFYHSFHVPNEVPLDFAITELITLLQLSLFYCGMLAPHYIDGFLCDYTIKASQNWWKKFGEMVGSVPNLTSPAYMSKTVAAIVGFILGCNYRLSLLGVRSPKDCFNVHQFLQSIYNFQKNERLDKTMRLNTSTVHRLRDLTAKQMATPDLISSLKTTVKENLRGKIQAAVNDFETTDLKVVASHAKGARAKYLWKATGHQFVPMGDDGVDPMTGIPASVLADDGVEPKSLLRSPRQKGTSKLLSRKQQPHAHPQHVQQPIDHPDSASEPPLVPTNTRDPSQLQESAIPDMSQLPRHPPTPTSKKHHTEHILTDKMLLTRDDTWLPRPRNELRRVQSTSNIEPLIFKWQFPASIARVYRDYTRAVGLRRELEQHLNSNKQTYDQLRETLASRGADFTNENRYSDTIKYRITQSTRKEQIVKQQVRNLEAIADKLDFQWTFLTHQVHEVEKAVESFSTRVESSVVRWERLQQRTQKRWVLWEWAKSTIGGVKVDTAESQARQQ